MPFKLTQVDRDIADKVQIIIKNTPKARAGFPLGEVSLPLQFPPRITDDTKSSVWEEQPAGTYEPIAVWANALPRRIGIEITYIATGGQFTPQKIAIITRQIKAYFYRSLEDKALVPIVEIKMYEHILDDGATFRMLDASFSFSETLIKDGDNIFPLMTKVKMNLALMTAIDGKQEIPNMPKAPKQGWY
jgi:hypothetical protein